MLELPNVVVDSLAPTPSQAAARLKELALVDLFRRGEVSAGYAAEVLGMSKWEFIRLLAEHEVPYVDATEDELRQELELAESIWPRAEEPPSPTADR